MNSAPELDDASQSVAKAKATAAREKVRSLVRILEKDDAIAALIKSCNEVGEAFLFGGIVRDSIMGSTEVFGDLDIFVSGPLDVDFVEKLSRTTRRTNFGGMRLVVGKFDVDIWELPKSYAFRIERSRSVSIPSLLRSVCFSTDAVAVSLVDSRMICSPIFMSTLVTNVLHFVSRPVQPELLQVVRIARLMVKNEVRPDKDVAEFYLRGERAFGRDKLLDAEIKWKGRRVLDVALIRWVSEVCELTIRGNASEEMIFGSKSLF
jgi:predicted nucleotidyltransferase